MEATRISRFQAHYWISPRISGNMVSAQKTMGCHNQNTLGAKLSQRSNVGHHRLPSFSLQLKTLWCCSTPNSWKYSILFGTLSNRTGLCVSLSMVRPAVERLSKHPLFCCARSRKDRSHNCDIRIRSATVSWWANDPLNVQGL